MSSAASDSKEETDKQEQAEWESVNRLLQYHGFKPIRLADPRVNKNPADVVLLDKELQVEIRHLLKTLMKDTERRQALIQELIQSNNQLKDDLRHQQGRASRQEERASDLERILDSVKSKIQELEDDYISKASQQQSHVKQLQKDKQDTQTRYQQLEKKQGEQEEVIARLKKKLYLVVMEEEQRIARQNKTFRQFRKRAARTHSVLDQQLLDVIDFYETRISHLEKEQRAGRGEGGDTQDELSSGKKMREKCLNLDATPNYKALLKSYQDQLKEAKVKNEQLVKENLNLAKELETRPTIKELKLYKQQIKRLEKILLMNNIRPSGVGGGADTEEWKEESDGTKVEDVDQMPPTNCRRFLKSVCKELGLQDVNELVSTVRLKNKQAGANPKLKKILSDINSVVTSQRAPCVLFKKNARSLQQENEEDVEETRFDHLLPTIEFWADQLLALKELQRGIKKLTSKLIPWHKPEPQSLHEGVKVEELMLLVDTVLEEVENKDKENRGPSPQTLQAIVSHFQKLFDVASVNGIYPRMNEVYIRLGELTNALRNVQDLLGLDDCTPPSVVVNMVGKLCTSVSEKMTREVQQLLGTQDIDSIIAKLEEYDEFFPAFQELVQNLLHILDVNNLDHILPAVRTLKLLSR
ncbi:centrosomal protein of 70 kDa [Latimeria chalumnae]|uniref:centrosomal protein of 70 kDa n=1 Tax=Latimeria chalumnae TaxID=7897 RepID=UPI00313CF2DF